MTRTTKRSLIVSTIACLCLGLSVPGASWSEDDPQAYLSKMQTMYDSPFSADYTMTMKMNQGGMEMAMDGTGDMLWADSTHMKINVTMTMKMPGSDQSMDMTMKTISDGTTTWTEMNNPMGQQVLKMDIAKAQALAEEQGMSASAGMSPLEQLRALQDLYSFTITEKSGGKVTLAGVIKDDAPEQMKAAGPMVEGMTLVLIESTGRLESFAMGPADAPAMVMKLTSYKQVKKSDVPSSLFSYTPAPGVTVMDPLAMPQQ